MFSPQQTTLARNGVITPNLQLPENELINNLQAQLQQAMNEINQLKIQVSSLQEHNEKLLQLNTKGSPPENKSYSPANSEEEENLVARETDWLLAKSKNTKNKNKKRKAEESPEKVDDSPKKQSEKTAKVIKPPPVILSNVKDYQVVKNSLNTGNLEYKTSMIGNNQIKVNVSSNEEYRALTALINKSNIEWHSYENKALRSIKVMARNLHPSTTAEEISNELKERNFKILGVTQKLKRTTNNNKVNHTRLPLYMLEFDRSEDIKKIYDIQYINHMKVKIETVRNSKLIPQCKRCQRHGHTRRFCRRTPACVKCAGQHLTTTCTKELSNPTKCINCSEAHPANYRGCAIAKELQKRRDTAKTKKVNPQPRQIVPNMVKPGISYAQRTQQKAAEPTSAPSITEPSMMQLMRNMMDTLNRVNARLDRLEARSTGTIPKTK